MFSFSTKTTKNICYGKPILNRIIIHQRWNSTHVPYITVHKPVMLQQVLDYMKPRSGGIYCDLTFGDGGYTKALLGE